MFIGGPIAERLGPRKVIFLSCMLSAVCTIAQPFVAKIHWVMAFLLRVLIGLLGVRISYASY